MKLIINNTSMVPIYEQIVNQIKDMIINGELKNDDLLPSVRTMAKDLKISALTVKKAYDYLESCGFAKTIHGKGTYITSENKELILEDYKKDLEEDILNVINKAKRANISKEEVREMFEIMLGE